jgi:hypothetical protein
MDMSQPNIAKISGQSDACTALDRRLARLDASLTGFAPEAAWREFEALHRDIADCTAPLKAHLLALCVAWADDDMARAAWICGVHRRFAAIGSRVAAQLVQRLGVADARSLGAIATTLFYMGETVKSEVALGSPASPDYAALHALMRMANASGHQRRTMRLTAGGRRVSCSLESLYFRTLLLARFASGTLSARHVEILDAWIFLWSPAIVGVSEPPGGSALRADLDSSCGLRRGVRAAAGESMYLSQEPIARAFEAVRARMQSGYMVPSDGCTAGFRIEDHMVVLDLVRRGLSQSLADDSTRASREPMNSTVELFVGLAEITARGYADQSAPATVLEIDPEKPAGTRAERSTRERDNALGSIFDVRRRTAQLVDSSDTGMGLEGCRVECGDIMAGDLVGVRSSPGEPLVLGMVVRSVGSVTAGRMVLGVRRLSSAGCPAGVRDTSREGASARLQMIFVEGEDGTGRRDGCLVTEREYERRARFEAQLGERIFGFRFNRVRERGRGWILAGFEIDGVRKLPCPAATA